MIIKRPPRKTVTLSLDEHVVVTVRGYATCTGRTFPRYVNRILKQHMERVEQTKQQESSV